MTEHFTRFTANYCLKTWQEQQGDNSTDICYLEYTIFYPPDQRLFYVSLNLVTVLTVCLNFDIFVTQHIAISLPVLFYGEVYPQSYQGLNPIGTSILRNRIQSNLFIAVTLHITATGQLPKIFSCLVFSAKLTCVQRSPCI